jgi:hypothetical protein
MINKSNISRVLSAGFALAGSILIFGSLANAQQVPGGRDPFVKPGYMKTNTPSGPGSGKTGKPTNVASDAPSIEARIEYYKRLREQAASNGAPLPKVTSVLTLNEMAVTGIFHTPRGYAAMVEAVPIKLAYTIYPGERFFDGQLVAVEENRLVFRRVTKTGNGKFVSSVENKTLREYSTKSVVEGTAPNAVEQANVIQPAPTDSKDNKASSPIVSPLDEMNKQPQDGDKSDKSKSAKSSKKPTKVAKNK